MSVHAPLASPRALTTLTLLGLLSTLCAPPLEAQEEGQVQIPLSLYETLLRSGTQQAPVGYALGTASVSVSASQTDDRVTARVDVLVDVQVLEDRWTLVPLVPGAAAVTTATANRNLIQLVSTPAGLAWPVSVRGQYSVVLAYTIEAQRYDAGYSLAVPLPGAPASTLDARLPGVGLSVALIPASTTTVSEVNGSTRVVATLPATDGIQLTWRTGAATAAGITRADYVARVGRESAVWTAELRAALPSDETAWIPLLGADVALIDVAVDGGPAPVEVRDSYFHVAVRGAGEHVVTLTFETPVSATGAGRLQLTVPQVPISRFQLELEGEKSVSVEPSASVAHLHEAGHTVATVNIPVTSRVAFSWTEAVPEAEVVEEALVNAIVYHLAHAEEGVLYVRAMAVFDVARGETSQFALAVPSGVQISSISGVTPGLADWRPAPDDPSRVNLFLDRQVTGEFRFDVHYEQIIGTGEAAIAEFPVPLIFARDVNRQRGMAALLSSRDLTLVPVTEAAVTRVGENQLPAFVREAVTLTVAHTYRYFETTATITARATPPERRQGLFDARSDTLISLGDVTLSGAATIDVDVKQGSLMDLRLRLPAGVNVLTISAPSLRNHETSSDAGEQVVTLAFTQEMEGQFRVELLYERIMEGDAGRTPVPLVHVEGADVEQGRIAIEALSAVEVQPAATEHLSTLEPAELPQQLILRTTNPILLAYKYVQATPRPALELRITQHRELEVQSAIIDNAWYQTLVTREGLAVTTARFTVRNSRQQFLRVRLPPGSEVWSAAVAGQAETPALANGIGPHEGTGAGAAGEPEVLINIIHSVQGFPVELIYATRGEPLGLVGEIESQLPRPDMVVTRTRWDVFVPDGLSYGPPQTELDVVEAAVPVYDMGDGAGAADLESRGVIDQPLTIDVPASGLRFTFQMLYANQAAALMGVALPYASEGGSQAGLVLALIGAGLLALVLVSLLRRPRPALPVVAIAAALGVVLVGVGMLAFHANPGPAVWLFLGMVAVGAVLVQRRRLASWWEARRQRRAARRLEERAAAAAPADPAPPAPEPPPAQDPPTEGT